MPNGGVDALIDANRKKPNLCNPVEAATETAVAFALKQPAFGQVTNDICEALNKTILQEFFKVAFRRKIYRSIEELQRDLDDWLHDYNYERTNQGKMCCERTPIQTLIDGKERWHDKITTLNN